MSRREHPTISAFDMYECTPADDAPLPKAGIAFQVRGDAGDVKVVTADGETRIIPDVQAFELITCQVAKVFASDTDATGIWIYV